MLFDWDDNKREKTLIERRIDFVDAVLVWEDPKRQERVDSRRKYGEKRIQTNREGQFWYITCRLYRTRE